MDREGLAAFTAIAEDRSFSRAAERLGIAQSMISKRVSRLEDRLGTRLVQRGGRSDVTLTRLGQAFLPEAQAMLANMADAERRALRLCRGELGPIRIGYVFSAGMSGVLAHLLHALRAALPDIVLEVELGETPQQLAALEIGKIDIALIRPRPSYPPGCHARLVHTEPMVLCMASHDALTHSRTVSPAMLADRRFIVPQFHEQVGQIDKIRALARAGKFVPREPTHTKDFLTAMCLASAGEGLVLVPASLANLGIANLHFRAIDGFDDTIDIVLLYRTDTPRGALEVVQNLQEAVGR